MHKQSPKSLRNAENEREVESELSLLVNYWKPSSDGSTRTPFLPPPFTFSLGALALAEEATLAAISDASKSSPRPNPNWSISLSSCAESGGGKFASPRSGTTAAELPAGTKSAALKLKSGAFAAGCGRRALRAGEANTPALFEALARFRCSALYARARFRHCHLHRDKCIIRDVHY